jgi:hypothetical protein
MSTMKQLGRVSARSAGAPLQYALPAPAPLRRAGAGRDREAPLGGQGPQGLTKGGCAAVSSFVVPAP